MTIVLVLGLVVGLLVLGFSTPVALGCASLVYFLAFSDLPFEDAMLFAADRVFSAISNYLLTGMALFVLYGRLCAEMSVRSRLASVLGGLFRNAGAATTAEVATSLVQPDSAGDALLQRNDEAAATVNRLRLAGAPGWSAIGQSAALAFLRAITPPGVLLIILGHIFNVSIGELFFSFAPFVLLGGLILMLLAKLTGPSKVQAAAMPQTEVRSSLSWMAVPFVLLGVVGLGYVTPVEVGALAAALALILGMIQRQLSGRRLLRALLDSVQDTGAIILVVVFASCLEAALKLERAPEIVTQWMSSLGGGPAVLAAVLAAAFVLSSIVGPLATLFVLGPMVAPAMAYAGVEPLRIAMVFGIATSLGLLAPPLGPIFATLAAGTTERFSRVILGISYFALAGFVALGMSLYGPIWRPW